MIDKHQYQRDHLVGQPTTEYCSTFLRVCVRHRRDISVFLHCNAMHCMLELVLCQIQCLTNSCSALHCCTVQPWNENGGCKKIVNCSETGYSSIKVQLVLLGFAWWCSVKLSVWFERCRGLQEYGRVQTE